MLSNIDPRLKPSPTLVIVRCCDSNLDEVVPVPTSMVLRPILNICKDTLCEALIAAVCLGTAHVTMEVSGTSQSSQYMRVLEQAKLNPKLDNYGRLNLGAKPS